MTLRAPDDVQTIPLPVIPAQRPAPAQVEPAAPTSGTDRPAAAQRCLWADAAKGFCIVLVVIWHAIWLHLMDVDWGIQLPVVEAWYSFGNALLPMRMPMFFVLSGVFAATAVTRPWRAVARSRIAKFAYLYAVWLLIHTAVLAVLPVHFEDRANDLQDVLEQLTITPTTTWYLYALVVYFVIAKLLHRAPMPLVFGVLAVTFALSAASSAGWQDVMASSSQMVGQRDAVVENLPYFLGGVFLRRHVMALAERTSWPRVVYIGLIWAVVLLAIRFFDASMMLGVWPAAGVVSTVFGITALAMAARWLPLGQLLAAIGQRTLPIYVMHLPLLLAVHWLVLLAPVDAAPVAVRTVLVAVDPVLLTVVLIALCTAGYALLRRRAAWLFDLPAPRRRASSTPDFVRS